MSAERHRALEILAGSSFGCTEATLLAHGLTTDLLVDLVHEGLATATPETVHVGKRPRCWDDGVGRRFGPSGLAPWW
jgi:hypothetical protein